MNRPPASLTRMGVLIASLVGMGSFALYVNTLAPSLLLADAAEFQLACYTLGIAHPTGYPLYLMLGWLWSHLVRVGDAAYRINLLSAACSASTVALFYLLMLGVLHRARQRAPGALLCALAVVSTLILALSRTFWSQALTAEVYALNSLFVVMSLALLIRWSESRSIRTLEVATLTYGLSLTHHGTMILFLPASLLFLWLTDRHVFRNARLLLVLLVLIVAPLLLYLYIPWRAPATAYLHINLAPGRTLNLYENTLRGFLGFLSGEMFVGELGVHAPPLERLSMAADLLLKQFGAAGVALGLLGVVKLALGGKGGRARRVLALLAVSYVALVGFTLIYNVGDIHVFYTPSYIIFAVWIGLGLAWLLDATVTLLSRLSLTVVRPPTYALVALAALLPVGLLVNNYPRVDRSHDYQARTWAEDVLSQPIPSGTILISNDRNEITPLLYLQYVEGIRADLLTMFPLMLPGEEYSNVVRVVDGVMDVGRPLFLIKPMPGLEIKYQMEPLGPLVEITGPAISEPAEHPTDLALGDVLTLAGYSLDPGQAIAGSVMKVSLFWRVDRQPASDYHTYVHLLDAQGQPIAQSDRRPGEEYYPSSLWQPGETLLDVHDLSTPHDAYLDSVTLAAGAYEYPSLVPLGDPLVLDELQISNE
jgi:hypothetical protein